MVLCLHVLLQDLCKTGENSHHFFKGGLGAFSITFVSLMCNLAPFGSIWAHLGLILGQFWHPRTHFLRFGVPFGDQTAQEDPASAKIPENVLPGGTPKGPFLVTLTNFSLKVRFCKTTLPCRREHRFDTLGCSEITLCRLKVTPKKKTRPKGQPPTPPPLQPLTTNLGMSCHAGPRRPFSKEI